MRPRGRMAQRFQHAGLRLRVQIGGDLIQQHHRRIDRVVEAGALHGGHGAGVLPHVADQSGDGHKTQRQPLRTEIVADPVGAERFVTLPHPLHLPPASESGGSPPGSLSWTRYTACPAWRQRRRPPPASVRRSDTRKTRPRSPPWRHSAVPAGRALRFLPPWCMMGKTCVRRAVPPRSLQ